MKNAIRFALAAFFAALLFSCAATSKPLKPVHSVKDAVEDEFFILSSSIISEDRSHIYERVKGKDLDPKVREMIQKEVRRTEKTYAMGLVYQSAISFNDTNSALFFMDTTITNTEPVLMANGKYRQLDIGERVCKWILYKTSPSTEATDSSEKNAAADALTTGDDAGLKEEAEATAADLSPVPKAEETPAAPAEGAAGGTAETSGTGETAETADTETGGAE
jgi:hypothetical protein